jgi:hypothetical protein
MVKMGRPKLPAAMRLSVVVRLLLTPDMARKLKRLGGVTWLREQIRQAKE